MDFQLMFLFFLYVSFLKNAVFEEAEPEFQQFAYFKTRICMRNALQVSLTSKIINLPFF